MNLFSGPIYLEFWQGLVLAWVSSSPGVGFFSCNFVQNMFNDFDMKFSCNVHNPNFKYFHGSQTPYLVHEFF